MNHVKHVLRLATFVFWAVIIGMLYSASQSISNLIRLGWPSQLLYLVVGIVVIYFGAVITKSIWSIK